MTKKKSEEQLTRQRDVMKTVIDNFPGAICLCDTDLRRPPTTSSSSRCFDFLPHLFAKGRVDFEDLCATTSTAANTARQPRRSKCAPASNGRTTSRRTALSASGPTGAGWNWWHTHSERRSSGHQLP